MAPHLRRLGRVDVGVVGIVTSMVISMVVYALITGFVGVRRVMQSDVLAPESF